jgi:hypothetical protein
MKKNLGNIFYVYEHWRPDTGECFYVGKGHGSRANVMYRRNTHHSAIQKKLKNLGMCVEIKLFCSGLSEREAFDLEVVRIRHWEDAGVCLSNQASGGVGVAGHVRNEEYLKKQSEARKGKPGRKQSEITKLKLSEARKGKTPPNREGYKHSEETKAKMSLSMKGVGGSKKGVKKTAQHCANISAGLTGKKLSLEHVEKCRMANLGRVRSDEFKAKVSAGMKLLRAKQREAKEANPCHMQAYV